MKLLLDTHVFLWWMQGDTRLPATAVAIIAEPANEIYISSITAVELAIKIALGKLKLPTPLGSFLSTGMAAMRAIELPLQMNHALVLTQLPPYHRDSFDRLLIAQAQTEAMQSVTTDSEIARYGVGVLS